MPTRDKQAKIGPGQFQWNLGGWLGGQVGGSVWILLLGVLLLFKAPLVGSIAIGLGLLANVCGLYLWSCRDRLAPYPAVQYLIVVLGLCALLALAAIHLVGHLEPELQIGQFTRYWVLLVYPGLMVMFYFQERMALRAKKEPPADNQPTRG